MNDDENSTDELLSLLSINQYRWVGIQPIRDKYTYRTKINPHNLKVIYSILTFETDQSYLSEGHDITLDMGENIETTYAYSITEIVNDLESKDISIDHFILRSESLECPL